MTEQQLWLYLSVVDVESPPVVALRQAIERVGSQAALARLLDISQTAVWKWVSKVKALPPEHVLAVEAATGISRHDLRPDIYPRDDQAPPHAGSLGDLEPAR